MITRKIYILLFAFFIANNLFGQTSKIDSLKRELIITKHDTSIVKLYYEIADAFIKYIPDTAQMYANKAILLSDSCLLKTSQSQKKIIFSLQKNKAAAINIIGNYFLYKGEFDKALENYQNALKIFNELNWGKGIATCLMNMGSICFYQKHYSEAIKYYQQALSVYENSDNVQGVVNCNTNIGSVFFAEGDNSNDSTVKSDMFNKAIDYYQKTLSIYEKTGNRWGVATSRMNIGAVYKSQKNYSKALECAFASLKIFEELSDNVFVAKSLLIIASIFHDQGDSDNAIDYYFKSLNICENLDDKIGMANCYKMVGNIYTQRGRYSEALDCFIKILKIYEDLGNKEELADVYSDMGNLYLQQANFDIALEYFLKSLKLRQELNNQRGLAIIYNNIGNVFIGKADLLKIQKKNRTEYEHSYMRAKEYYLNSYEIASKIDDIELIAFYHNNMGIIYERLLNFEKALESYQNALQIYTKQENIVEISRVNSNIASMHITLADIKNGDDRISHLKYAIQFAQKSMNLARVAKAMPLENEAAKNLMNAYKGLGNYKKAMAFAEVYIETTDSLFNEAKIKEINGLQLEYERERNLKEKTILEKDMVISREKNQKQKIIIASISAGFGLLVFMVTFILRRLQITRRQKKLIEEQNNEIKEKNEELNQLNEEVSAQRDNLELMNIELTLQRDQIARQHEDITASINYASRIQQAMLPPTEIVAKHYPEYFVMYRPCQIVSGDFYWFKQFKNIMYIAAADCTGHGVPGAFMSMLGLALLNETIGPRDTNPPHESLNEIRKRLKKTLHQTGQRGEQQDGMDIALCMIDLETNIIQFAGAYNPFYLVRNNELIVHKGDRMPIGIHPKDNESFTTKEIHLKPNDCFYIFSDGYVSQTGGSEFKKLKSSRLQEILIQINDHPMSTQKKILEETFDEWKGHYEQVDDVLMLGIKLN